jgi:hypothetical protein
MDEYKQKQSVCFLLPVVGKFKNSYENSLTFGVCFFQILKVVGNEKGAGSGGWLLFEDAFGPWRSMSVYFLMLPSSLPRRFPFPVCKAQLIGD